MIWTGAPRRLDISTRLAAKYAVVCLATSLSTAPAHAEPGAACSWVVDLQSRLSDRLTVARAIQVDAPRFTRDDITCLCESGIPAWIVELAREEFMLDSWSQPDQAQLDLFQSEPAFPLARQAALALVVQLRRAPDLYAEDGFYFHAFSTDPAGTTWLELDRFAEAFADASIALDATRSRALALRASEVDGIDRRRLTSLVNGPSDPGYERVTRYLKPRATAFLGIGIAGYTDESSQLALRIDRFGQGKAQTTADGLYVVRQTGVPLPACSAGLGSVAATGASAGRGGDVNPSPSAGTIRLRRWYAWTGVGLGVVGGVVSAIAYGRFQELNPDNLSVSTPERLQALTMWRDLNIAAGAIGIAGGVTASVGFALPLPKRVRTPR